MRHLAAVALCWLLACNVLPSRAALPLPGDASIALSGDSGKASETRTIGLILGDGEKAPVLVAGDLMRTMPAAARIDRSHVRVAPAASSPAGMALYEVTVSALPERYGSYQGTITVMGGGETATNSVIAITLLVRVPASLPLTALPPAVTLPLAAGNTSKRPILSNWPSVGEARVAVASLPAGADVTGVRMTPLVSVRGYGELGDKKYVVQIIPGGMRLQVDAAHARPDKYTAIAEMDLAGSDRRISVPVEVTVRTSPPSVVALLMLGILLGRVAKWMNEGGQKLLAAQTRIDSLALRVATLDGDYQRHLEKRMGALQRLVNQNQVSEFDAAFVVVVACLETLERTASLRALARLKADTDAQAKLDEIAAEVCFLTRPESLKSHLDFIETALIGATGADDAMAAPVNVSTRAAATLRSARLRIAMGLHWALDLAGVVLLSFVGYEVLYLNGSPTFGANFSDYFGLLVWGLGADVAARTITTLGRLPAR